jgi:hypothetical protein
LERNIVDSAATCVDRPYRETIEHGAGGVAGDPCCTVDRASQELGIGKGVMSGYVSTMRKKAGNK